MPPLHFLQHIKLSMVPSWMIVSDRNMRSNKRNHHSTSDGRYYSSHGRIEIILTWSVFLLLQCLIWTVDAAGSAPEGFIDEVVTNTKAMSGTFAPNPRLNNKPMMVLNDKNGRVHVLENPDDSSESLEILDLQDKVCTNGERGLHSIIPHPNFSNNRWMYAFYTKYRQDCLEDPVLGAWNVVERFTMDATTLELNANEGVEIWRGMCGVMRISVIPCAVDLLHMQQKLCFFVP
jgi:Glucose / Sorbosone dehydrogenase